MIWKTNTGTLNSPQLKNIAWVGGLHLKKWKKKLHARARSKFFFYFWLSKQYMQVSWTRPWGTFHGHSCVPRQRGSLEIQYSGGDIGSSFTGKAFEAGAQCGKAGIGKTLYHIQRWQLLLPAATVFVWAPNEMTKMCRKRRADGNGHVAKIKYKGTLKASFYLSLKLTCGDK